VRKKLTNTEEKATNKAIFKHSQEKDKQKLSIKISSLDRYLDFWEDGTVVIKVKIGVARIIESYFFLEVFDLDREVNARKEVQGFLRIVDSSGESEKISLNIRKKSVTYRGQKREKIIINSPQIYRACNKRIELTIPPCELTLTPLYQLIQQIAYMKYEIQNLVPFLRPSKKISTKFKYHAITSFLMYLQKKRPSPILEFTTFYNKKIQLFDDDILAVTFEGASEGSSAIRIPEEIINLIIHQNNYLVLVRNGQLVLTKLSRVMNAYQCASAIEIKKGTLIDLLWCGLERSKDFDFMVSCIKKGWDYRPHFLLAFLKYRGHSLSWEKNFYDKLITFLQKVTAHGHSFPIIRSAFRNPIHRNPAFECWLRTIMTKTLQTDNSSSEVFILREVLISNKEGNYHFSADWFLAFLKESGKLEKYVIELKTTNSVEQTRTLQRAISQYSELTRQLPDAGIPIIITGWPLNKKKWLDYASCFNVLLLDPNDIFELAVNNHFYKKLHVLSSKVTLNSLGNIKPSALISSKKIINHWKQVGKATQEEINEYCLLMKIPIQNLLFLFGYLKIVNINPSSSYYRKGYLEITNSSQLDAFHYSLKQGTAIIIEEELHHCTNRIYNIQNGLISIPKAKRKSCERRRQTFDINRLQIMQNDLELLLSLRLYWEKRFRPVGVRMLIYDQNQGAFFENEIYQELLDEGLLPVRHLAVMISSRAREIDLVAFQQKARNSSKMIAISCSDSSNYQKKFHDAKRDIQGRLFNLRKIKEVMRADEARLYVKVANSEQEQKVHEWFLNNLDKENKENLFIVVKIG